MHQFYFYDIRNLFHTKNSFLRSKIDLNSIIQYIVYLIHLFKRSCKELKNNKLYLIASSGRLIASSERLIDTSERLIAHSEWLTRYSDYLKVSLK